MTLRSNWQSRVVGNRRVLQVARVAHAAVRRGKNLLDRSGGIRKLRCRALRGGESLANLALRVSSAGESHPHALSEPDVNLSAHPAPIMEPPP